MDLPQTLYTPSAVVNCARTSFEGIRYMRLSCEIVRKSAVLRRLACGLWVAACGAAFSVNAQPSLGRFKELLSSPPVIEEILAERRYNGSKPTDYYYGRWQSNAFLLSISTNREQVAIGGRPGSLTQVYGRVDDHLWTVFGTNRPLKIGAIGSVTLTNELVLGTYWASVDMGRLLNCGVDHLKPGQIRWKGNTYAGTNDSGEAAVSGELRTNLSGVVTQLSMNISIWSTSRGSPETLPKNYHWQLEYEYDSSVSELYPSVVKRFVVRPKDRFLRDEIHIHSVKLASGPLPSEMFSYKSFIYTNSWSLYATNNSFYYIGIDGKVSEVQRASPPAKPATRLWFFLFAGACLLVPAALFRTLNTRAKKQEVK